MSLRAIFVLAASLPIVGCAAGPGALENTPHFGAFTTSPQDGRVVLEVHFHGETETREICRRLSKWPEQKLGAPACVSDQFTPGVAHLHVARPRDWDDWPVLIELGHELLHRLGAEHP